MQRRGTIMQPQAHEIRNVLLHYKRSGIAVDPDNPAHQNAYVALRATRQRVNGAQVLQYVDTVKNQLTHGATTELALWQVPRTNFPAGLPIDLKVFVKTADDLVGFAMQNGTRLDFSLFYILDQAANLQRSGWNVRIVRLFLTNACGRPSSTQPAAGGTGCPSISQPATGGTPATGGREYEGLEALGFGCIGPRAR